MIQFIINKFFYGVLTLFGVVTVIFLLFNVLPGDPARMMLDQREDSEQLKNIRKKYGFDQPLTTQYLYYLNDISPLSIHSSKTEDYTFLNPGKYSYITLFSVGEFTLVLKYPYLRESFQKNGKKVSEVISETLPNTAILALFAICIAIGVGILFGILSAIHKDTWLDRVIAVISTFGMSVPSFFSAILFAWIFGFLLHNFTGLEMTGSLYVVDDFGEKITMQWKNLILPALVLGIRPLAVIIQLMRNSLLEVLSQDYIRTAKAKGICTSMHIERSIRGAPPTRPAEEHRADSSTQRAQRRTALQNLQKLQNVLSSEVKVAIIARTRNLDVRRRPAVALQPFTNCHRHAAH